MKALSIIIPVYNVEKYIRECLDSIKHQTYTNFQAILINDGSTDNSAEIIREYTKQDSRFILINQENKGAGEARNTGLRYLYSNDNKQDTKYVGMVDPDDVIARDYYENLIYSLESHNAVLVKTKNVVMFNDNKYDSNIFCKLGKKTKGKVRLIRKDNPASKTDLWRCVFDISLVKDIRFPKVSIGEDVAFLVFANIKAGKEILTRGATYFYRIREKSLTKVLHKPEDLIESFRAMYEYFEKHNLLQEYILPTHIIKPNKDYLKHYPNYFHQLKNFIQKLDMPQQIINNNKFLKELLIAKNAEELLANTQSFKEWRRNNFRIRISKKQTIIRIFGKTFYQKYNH